MIDDEDLKERAGEAAPAFEAARDYLAKAGIELPEPPIGAKPVIPPRDTSVAFPMGSPEREARMLELGWPLRAIECARRPAATPALVAMREWDPRLSAVVLAGDPGTGKTVAAAWYALTSPKSAVMRFARASQLARASRFGAEWKAWLAAPALCIDDLGSEYTDAKGSFLADLDELIDAFYSDRRPLIVSTNVPGKDFAERYSARIRDRLHECARWVPLAGKSLRRKDTSK